MVNVDKSSDAAAFVRELAEKGDLKRYAAAASEQVHRWLWAGAGEIVWPLVFGKVTRRYEHSRGHFRCATAVQRMEPDCLDRFHNDVEAVTAHLFANADTPIRNLEGWLTMCLQRATVDAHRRRRSQRGAPQRPRLTAWLKQALGEDPWLMELAGLVLDWVGVEATAGAGLWPLAVWADRRAVHTGDHIAGETKTAADVERVLAAMRRRPSWYERNVERPLGHKQAPVWMARRTAAGTVVEPEPLMFVDRHEAVETLLSDLAAEALDLIRHRVRHGGEEPETVVAEVLRAVFTASPVAYGLEYGPDAQPAEPEQVEAIVADPARLDGIVAEVLLLLRCRPSEQGRI